MRLVDVYPNAGVGEMSAAEASGPPEARSTGRLPAMWWLGVLLALILIRLVYEIAE